MREELFDGVRFDVELLGSRERELFCELLRRRHVFIEQVQAERQAAFSLPVGAVSDPVQTEEGLVIIRVVERKGVDSPLAKEQALVTLGRILLLMAHPVPEKSDEVLRREIGQARLKELQTPWLKALQERTRFEYPNGTNFFGKGKTKKK